MRIVLNTNTQCRLNVEFLNVKAGGIYNGPYALKCLQSTELTLVVRTHEDIEEIKPQFKNAS